MSDSPMCGHQTEIVWWEGFNAAIEMVINSFDSQDSNEIAKFSVFEFIEDFKEHLIEEVELYKRDG